MHDHAPYLLDFYKGNTLPLIDLELEGEDITGYTFVLTINFKDGTCLTKTGVIDDANVGGLGTGLAHFDWVAGDLSRVGTHNAKVVITDALGREETFAGFAIRILNV